MINKKYKGFSLIEAMVLFTALSLILIAFLPIMLKRPQKAADSDCVGGLRSVRQELGVGSHDFVIPDSIASDVSVVLMGAGGGGGNPVVESRNDIILPDCEFSSEYIASDYAPMHIYRNMFLTMIGKGREADCGNKKAGSSGDFYQNLRIFPKINTNEKTDVFKVVLNDDGTLSSTLFNVYGDNTYNLNTASVGKELSRTVGSSTYTASIRFAKILGETGGTLLPKPLGAGLSIGPSQPSQILPGGVPSIRINNQDNVIAGVGQKCVWDAVNKKYVADGEPTDGVCKISYNFITLGNPGASGTYLRVVLPLDSGVPCNISVGQGGASGGGKGGDTSITCNNGAINYIARGANGNKGGGYYPDYNTLLNDPYVTRNDRFGNPRGSEDVYANKDSTQGLSTYTGAPYQGGRSGCHSLDGDVCNNPNGRDGLVPGSGGGGGSCSEERCGVGGRGGDGVAIVEYLEYCR